MNAFLRALVRFFKGVKDGMKLFGEDIATIVNSVLLAIVYILGVGITAIVARAAKKKFLDLKPAGKSYWKDTDTRLDEESYYRQF